VSGSCPQVLSQNLREPETILEETPEVEILRALVKGKKKECVIVGQWVKDGWKRVQVKRAHAFERKGVQLL
jgi:hypothetical protein